MKNSFNLKVLTLFSFYGLLNSSVNIHICGLTMVIIISISEFSKSLPKFNVDIKETSISGFSSGASFAHQLQVALSSIIKGVGIIAGSHYNCGGLMSAKKCRQMGSPPINQSIALTNKWSSNLIDNITFMNNQRVYMISGTNDETVGTSVMNQLYKYLVTEGKYVPESNVVYKHDLQSVHTFPTDFDSPENSECSLHKDPHISNCGFDGAGAILNHIYGTLNGKAVTQRTGHFIEFSQTEFISNHYLYGLDKKGFAFVPKNCSDGQKCKLHIAFHGCSMSYTFIGDKFVKNTGYDRWADTNNIIVVFPQTAPDFAFHLTPSNLWVNNMKGCWDWLGYYGSDFPNKKGKQIQFIKNIIERISK